MNFPLKGSEVSAVGHAEELTLIHGALVALRRGDAKAKLPLAGTPAFARVAEVFNELVEQNVAISSAEPGSCPPNWLQGTPSTVKPRSS